LKKIISAITVSAILATSIFSMAFANDGTNGAVQISNIGSQYFADRDNDHGNRGHDDKISKHGESVSDSVYDKDDDGDKQKEDSVDLKSVTDSVYTYSQTKTPSEVVDLLYSQNVSLKTIVKAVYIIAENNENKYPGVTKETIEAYSAAIQAKMDAIKEEIQTKVDTLQGLTDLYDKAGDLEKAINNQKKAIMTDYKNILSYKKIGEMFNKKGDKNIKVFTVGEQVYFSDVQPVIKSDRTLVPIRAISESLKADVQWDEATKTITLTKDGVVIKLVLGSDTATINDQEVKLDVPADTIDNRTMVPVRFISQAFKSTVQWEPDSQIVVIY